MSQPETAPEPVRGGSYVRCPETHSLTCVEGPGAQPEGEAVAEATTQPAADVGADAGSQE